MSAMATVLTFHSFSTGVLPVSEGIITPHRPGESVVMIQTVQG